MQGLKYRGIEVPGKLAALAKHIDPVNALIDDMKELQSSWDNLSLLGELTRVGTEISITRQHFKTLSESLSNKLIEQSIDDAAQQLECKAQNAIDVLVRNLFERTADIGFLCTDPTLSEDIIRGPGELTVARLKSYAQKYTVYRNVVLLDAAGVVQCDMAGQYPAGSAATWLPKAVAHSATPYIERHGPLLDVGDASSDLVYAWECEQQGQIVGFVALQFNLQQEGETLFQKVLGIRSGINSLEDLPWTVCGIADEKMRVLMSSDSHQVPAGLNLQLAGDGAWKIARIGSVSYLACCRSTRGYQGYMGPGWMGFAMVPVHQAFKPNETSGVDVNRPALQAREGLIKEEICQFRSQAEHIQTQLNRSVWNGNLGQKKNDTGLGDSFSKTLLWEISRAGERTKQLFERTLKDLEQRAFDRIEDELEACAMLAMDLMDRNLYERANDCRWWADNPLLQRCLGTPGDQNLIATAQACLKHINDLYTVYTNVLLVDVQGKVVCSSQPCHGVDKLDTPWLAQALRLNDKQHYAVSPFEESPLYAGRPTYLYCAPVLKNDASHTKALGAVVLVFDAEPQFEAILRESMAGHHAAMAYIVDEEGNVISSTSNRFIHNGQLKLPLHFTTPFQKQSHWHQVLSMDGVVYAVGCCNSANYREYKSEQDCYQNNLTGVYLMDMGVEVQPQKTKPLCFEHLRSSEATKHSNLEVATFRVGSQWYGVDTAQVQESFVAKHLATMPNAQPCVLGSTLHKGRAVTVLDLAVLMDQTEQYQQSDARQEPIQLVLLKSSEDGMTLALRADALGEIPNIPVEEIQPTEQLLGKNPLLAGLVKTPSNLLLLLEPGKLMDQLRGKEKGLFWEEAFDGARDLEKAINAHSRVSHCEALPR